MSVFHKLISFLNDCLSFGTITQVNNQFLIKRKFSIICSNNYGSIEKY
ncbi:Hypothetical protein P9301_08701 [Prochlorococcus marinus str. MIT 9301]|uniref:Uncharacterized protein n=1 Tax=Prochlorococcus marinus (strain MIT 9301) TaxID=167546 RepID=A3PCL8_PROM0|nr:Hypothetical protein P9301_08701 [Prochlorococcus marinus str. MIT 9301]